MYFLRICSILFFTLAGFCVFVMVLNGWLMHIMHGRAKVPVVLLAFIILTAGGVLMGFVLDPYYWIYVPVAVLCFALASEIHRIAIRRFSVGSRPAQTRVHIHGASKFITTRNLISRRYEIFSPHWQGEKCRIVHLTDLHIHQRFPASYYNLVFDTLAAVNADIAVYTGDFLSNRASLHRLGEFLRPAGRLGTFAVLGNHDLWKDPEGIAGVLKAKGIRLLDNESIATDIDGSHLILTGDHSPWKENKNIRAVPLGNNSLHLALSHTPDNIYKLAEKSVDVVFSGHFHAGQIRFPLLGSLVIPSVYGRRFEHGHFIVEATHLFVASGVGTAFPPFRICCPPDIFIVDIHGK